MLRIRMVSGEELATIPVEEVSSVRALKRRLQQLHGLPPMFRQRLLLQGSSKKLDDDDKVDLPMDLELVVLNLCSTSLAQADEFVAASKKGSVDKAGLALA